MSDEEDSEIESGDEEEDTKGKAAPRAQADEEEEEEEDEEEEEEEEDLLKGLNLGKACIDLLRNAFTAFDHEKKGVLGTEMIGVILELLGHSLTPDALNEIIREVDADGSGELEFEEFVILASKFLPEDESEDNPEQQNKDLKDVFRFYDKEGNGYITIEDFKLILLELDPEIPETDLEGMLNEIDQDDSGTVDFAEFMAALQ